MPHRDTVAKNSMIVAEWIIFQQGTALRRSTQRKAGDLLRFTLVHDTREAIAALAEALRSEFTPAALKVSAISAKVVLRRLPKKLSDRERQLWQDAFEVKRKVGRNIGNLILARLMKENNSWRYGSKKVETLKKSLDRFERRDKLRLY